MIRSPRVGRNRKWDNEKKQYALGDKILLTERTFDGIETDYTDRASFTPDEARYVATELWKYAEQIDGKSKKTSAIGSIRKRVKQIAKEAKKEAEA